MANNVGIDVKINLPSKSKVMEDLKSKWGTGDNAPELLTNVRANKNSLNKMKTQIRDHFKDYVFEIDVKANFKQADKGLKDFRQSYHELRKEMEKGLDMKFNSQSFASKDLQGLFSNNSQKIKQAQDSNKQYIDNIKRSTQEINANTQKTTSKSILNAENTLKELDETTTKINAFRKEIETFNGQKIEIKTEISQKDGIAEYVKLTKEAYDLEKKKVGSSKEVANEYQNIINKINEVRKTMAEDYNKEFGEDISNNLDVARAESIGKANAELQKQLQLQQEQKALEAERKAALDEVIKKENEMYKLAKQSQKADDSQKAVYAQRIADMEKANAKKLESIKLTEQEKTALDTLRANNQSQLDFANNLAQAKEKDVARTKEQQQALQALKSDLTAIQKIETQIVELKAKQDEGVTTDKENAKLRSLESELKVRKESYEVEKKMAQQDDKLTSKGEKELTTLKKKYDLQKKVATEKAKEEANTRKENTAYKALESSIDKVSKLKKDMATAGSREAGYIREVISAEEAKQKAIEDSIKSQKNFNKAKLDEVKASKEAKYAQAEEDGQRNALKALDAGGKSGKKRISTVMNIDPIRVAQTAKRAFDMVYESVARLDEQIVNITKVSDEPAHVLEEFSRNVFDQASNVGKAADEYAGSVANWLTMGKTFQESQELATTSVMGAFVGNINEEDMVKYMAVPLNAFKDQALEATDIINAMNEVANNNNAEMTELGEAYSRAAATSATAGNSFSELTGMITAAQEATMAGGEKIGTSLKSIDLAIGQIGTGRTKKNAEDLELLAKMGVNIKDAEGNLRSTYEVLGDLAGRWQYLSPDDRTIASTVLAGKNHSNVLQGIVKNWDTAEKATKEASDQINLVNKESGSAFQEFEKQQDSVAFKTNNLKNEWDKLLTTIAGGKDGVNGVLDILIKGLEKANELIQDENFVKLFMNGLKVGGLLLGAKAVSGAFGKIAKSAKGLKDVFGLFTGFKSVGSIFTGGKIVSGIAKAVGLLGGVGPILGGIVLGLGALQLAGVDVIGGMVKLFDNFKSNSAKAKDEIKKQRQEQEKLNEAVTEGLEAAKKQKQVDDTQKDLDDLIEKKRKELEEANKLADASGKERPNQNLALSSEEFAFWKKEIEALAGEYNLDIVVERNNLDEVIEKLRLVKEEAKAINEQSIKDGMQALEETTKYKRPEFMDDSKYSKSGRSQQAVWSAEKIVEDLNKYWDRGDYEGTSTEQMIKSVSDALKSNLKTAYADAWNSEEARAAEEENMKRIADLKAQQAQLKSASLDGYLPEHINESSMRLLASELGTLHQKKTALEEINKIVKEGGDLSDEQLDIVRGIDPTGKLNNLSNITSKWNKDELASYNSELEKLQKTLNDTSVSLESVVRSRAGNLGMKDGDIDNLIKNMQSNKQAYIDELAKWGDEGKSLLGVTLQFEMETGENWSQVLSNMQAEIDKLTPEKTDIALKYDIITGDGFANIEKIDDIYNLPPEIQKKFNLITDDGGVSIGDTVDFVEKLANMPQEFRTKFDVDTKDGMVDLEEFTNHINELTVMEFNEIMLALGMDDSSVLTMLEEITGLNPEMLVLATTDPSQLPEQINSTLAQHQYNVAVGIDENSNVDNDIQNMLNSPLYEVQVQPKVNPLSNLGINAVSPLEIPAEIRVSNQQINWNNFVDTSMFQNQIDSVMAGIDVTIPPVEVDVKASANVQTTQEAIDKLHKPLFEIKDAIVEIPISETGSEKVTSATQAIYDGINSIDKSVNINFTATKSADLIDLLNKSRGGSIPVNFKGSKVSESVATAISDSIASSFSVGAESVANIQSATSMSTSTKSTRTGNPRYANNVISQDIWRYWSKELFTGLPLENALNELKRSIDKASDNEAKLISLYKQQQALLNKQIKYEQDMKKATQAEMNAILSDLRKQGFKTSGNKITNLSHAKSIKGEDAITLANENLNKYNTLYNSLNSYADKILSLQFDKQKLNDSIKDAEMAKELKSIEKRIKKTETLLTAIQNNTSITSKKIGMADSADYELKLSLNEEGANRSKSNINILITEFNALSKTYVKHGENAEKVQSQLENLKSQILENADAILDYQSAIKDIKIDRFANDIGKFTDVMDKNISRVKSNIDQIKDGLLSGTKLSDLQSAGLSSLNLQRKTALEKEYEQRLALEAKLNEALDGYAKKNVDQTAKVANSVLTIEKNKYAQLLKMQKEFTNGKVGSVTSITPSTVVGKTKSEDTSSTSKWSKNLEKINNDYVTAYNSMVRKYDEAMTKSNNQTQKDMITNDFIISQLKLQEEMYQKLIDTSKNSIKQANEMLKDTGLSTSQREQIEQQISNLEETIISSQESIKESVKSRYELEFALLDELTDKAQRYSTELEELLQINDLVNNDPSSRTDLLDAVYESYINQYGNARKELSRLLEEQSKVSEGSMEWKMLQERIEDVRSSLNGLTIEVLEANKAIMENRMDAIQNDLAGGLFGGKTSSEWEEFVDKWMVGLEKELELDKIRRRAIALESDMYDKKIEALDLQESASKKDLEYLDKQLSVLELEEKLQGLQSEKNVQTLVQNDDGTWQWAYVADQTEIDKTQDELDDARLELEQYRNEQRGSYFKELSSILDSARSGEYDDVGSLKNALNTLRDVYGYVLDDAPGLDFGNFDEVIKTYQEYLSNNQGIISEVATGKISPEYEALVERVGTRFEQGFMNIATDLGNVIAEALRNAITGAKLAESGESYVIENQELVFPNVTNTDGFREVLETLPAATKQETTKK